MGISPAAASYMTGFALSMDSSNTFSTSSLVVGNIYASDYTAPTPAKLTTAISHMEAAYTAAAGRTPDFTDLYSGDISGQTLVPGVYKWGTCVLINTDVTLEGGVDDIWIFEVAQGITQASGTRIILSGGAQSGNIYWQAAETVSIGTDAHFEGNILAMTLIEVKTGATVDGRLLAQAAVTLDANTITLPPVVSEVVVTGTPTIPIPGSGEPAVIDTYTAVVLDQFDNVMTGESITWALQAPVAGVSINETGVVTVEDADTTTAGTFTVVATSVTAPTITGTQIVNPVRYHTVIHQHHTIIRLNNRKY